MVLDEVKVISSFSTPSPTDDFSQKIKAKEGKKVLFPIILLLPPTYNAS
jgi:hypothetical protein